MPILENPIKIFDAQNIFDYIEIGYPYHPKNPAFFILKKGRVVYTENVDRIELTANHVAIIDSRRVYEILEISDDLELLLVAFSREYTEKLPLKINRLNAFVWFRNELVRHFRLEPEPFDSIWKTTGLLKSVLERPEPSAHRDEVIRHLFSSTVYLFADMIVHASRFSKEKISRKQEIVLQFLKNVGDCYLEEREVSFYADKQFITSRHLTSVLKEVTGQTAGQIIAAFVMKEAKAQLSTTEQSLYEIALNLKFSDQYSFGHFFKKHSGESPNAYRKRFRG